LNVEVVDVVRAVEAKVHALEYIAEEQGLRLTFEAETPQSWAALDLARLNRIVESLVGNAIKFSDTGHIYVRVKEQESRVCMAVQDDGVGISEPFLQKMFEAFYQESTGDARLYEGMGLGLTITKHLAHKMGGTISVQSQKGTGSTFVVSFPKAEGRLPKTEGAIAAYGPRRVLVVDDDPDTCHLIRYMLTGKTQVDTVSTAAQAMERAQACRYDAVLLDMELGQHWGTDVLGNLRTLPDYENVPIIALTVYASLHHRRRFIQEGFDDYLSKPFSKESLLRVLGLFNEHESQV